MSKYDHQELDITFAFGNWMRKWNKEYSSVEEGDARFEDFKNNVLRQSFIPASGALWDLLNDQADQPRQENFNHPLLDFRSLYYAENDDYMTDFPHFVVPLYQGFGIPDLPTPEEYRRYCDEQKELDLKYAFQQWRRKWGKEYHSTDEQHTRFQDFKNNILHQPFIPASDPLWHLLNNQADQRRTENFNVLRLDICPCNFDSDYDELPDGLSFIVPVKKEDGTIDLRCMTPEEYQRYSGQKKYDTKEEDQDDATVKHQSTVLPFKHTIMLGDDKDDTVKRQKIGCGGHKPGCCSDCGK